MEHTQQQEQKWGFWLFMLNYFSLDSIARSLLFKTLNTPETTFSQYFITFIIAVSLTFGIKYVLRHRPWKDKVWTTGIIVMISLALYILRFV
ncbi:hypothetical protein DYBT9623_04205 [Dyadobacter sp. CECT 9623]|uniref:Uncharacterized protein n=1 Tax=Dyadobacter linearis TaxID=2823330 RepID=A0ABM8UVA1_9BACT|nr:hypothetical protein [Dyadobacter sp. CECT 9623]CAG5072590.1 hypothetical protein DYBT9623_04205 [Dyadobacter sp. CECT 9623]